MPVGLVNISNFFAITSVTNSRDTPVTIQFSKPIDAEPLDICDINFVEKMEVDGEISQNQDDILKKQS